MCRIDGPRGAAFKAACVENQLWGCFSIMEFNPNGNPYNTGLIIDDTGAIALYYRKLHPWVPVEAWEPGNLGVPVFDGPNGGKLALIICHDGMFPEMARESAYKGAEIMMRTAGYTAPIPHLEDHQPGQRLQNLVVTANVCLCGSDGSFDSMGEGMFCNFDGTVLAEGSRRPDEIITCELRPDLVREARSTGGWRTTSTSSGTAATSRSRAARWTAPTRSCTTWSTAASSCPGKSGRDVDGTSCGFAPPTRPHDPNNMLPAARERIAFGCSQGGLGHANDCARSGRRGDLLRSCPPARTRHGPRLLLYFAAQNAPSSRSSTAVLVVAVARCTASQSIAVAAKYWRRRPKTS